MDAPLLPARYLLALGMFLLSVLLYVDRVCISAAQGAVARDLQLDQRQMGWVLSAFALGYALCQVPAGFLADRFGPRRVLTAVIGFWSLFTGLTGTAMSFPSLLLYRFLFGAGEAGAYPSCARATFSWIPVAERGLVQGINFSGARLGAAFALPGIAWLVGELGWRGTFALLAAVGFACAGAWYISFRDDPAEHPRVSGAERALILAGRAGAEDGRAPASRYGKGPPLGFRALAGSRNMWLAMGQYFSSNFTFFFCLTWLFPHLKDRFHLEPVETGLYSSAPFLAGALGNWVSGAMVDWIYRRGRLERSRRLPAMIGFALAAGGLVAAVFMETAPAAVACLSVAVFGADMTLSPSWALCIDLGGRHAGTVSGTMNMAGNLGSFVTSLAFPYLKGWTGSEAPFFFVGAGLNALAIGAWALARPGRRLEEY